MEEAAVGSLECSLLLRLLRVSSFGINWHSGLVVVISRSCSFLTIPVPLEPGRRRPARLF